MKWTQMFRCVGKEFGLLRDCKNVVECPGEGSARPFGTRDRGRDAVPRVTSAAADSPWAILGHSLRE
jgi:hypothetical protein